MQDESIASQDKNKSSPCQQDASCQTGVTNRNSAPYLPEDIWYHIHSLMPLRDAGLTASVSRAFLCSWRRRPSLIFSNQTLGLNESARGKDEIARDFTSIVDNILENYLGTGMKILKLLQTPNYSGRYHRFIDRWLQKAATLGVQELTLTLAEHFTRNKYKFPCSIFAHGNRDSIRRLYLRHCTFHPTVGGLGCSTSLVRLDLFAVYIKGDELGHLLSKSLALESLDLMYCCEIVCVKIPCLQRLTHLSVHSCSKLQTVESKAPNLTSFHFASDNHVQLSLGKALHVKTLYIDCSRPICHSRAKLASSTPNLEPLGIHSGSKRFNNGSLESNKFLHLESLNITLRGLAFPQSLDHFATVSSPSLDTFISHVSQQILEHPNYEKIRFFSVARTWVHLTCHVLRAWLS